MFTPIHLLRGASEREALGYRDRWLRDKAARSQQKLVLELITKGGGEDFLAPHVDNGELPILEDDGDLRGLKIFDKKIDFPTTDNFSCLDLSYGMVAGCEFNGATFTGCTLHFSSFHNCVLRRCTFAINDIYASTFRDVQFIDCVFPSQHFWNCEFFRSRFLSCVSVDDLMLDCKADSTCEVELSARRPVGSQETHRALPDNKRASLFKGISEAYAAGGEDKLSRRYYYKHMQELRRHDTTRWEDRVSLLLLELVTGHGVKSVRVLGSMIAVLMVSSLSFSWKLGWWTGMMLAFGAFFTFGANIDQLALLSPFWKIFYVLTAFFGVSLTALFITVLANVRLRQR